MDKLLKHGYRVRIMESFENGRYRHIPFSEDKQYEFMQGYIGNYQDCQKAVRDVEIIFHLGMPIIPTPKKGRQDVGAFVKIGDEHWSIFCF